MEGLVNRVEGGELDTMKPVTSSALVGNVGVGQEIQYAMFPWEPIFIMTLAYAAGYLAEGGQAKLQRFGSVKSPPR